MPKIIVSSRYLKNGKSKQVKNLVNYIATREGVMEYSQKELFKPITKKQEHLIKKLLELFPESKKLFEYDDYIANPNIKNANELVSEMLERYGDEMNGRASLVSYMAERPGVQKMGTHGLFSMGNDEIDLTDAMTEVAEHDGNIWSHVVSLKRDDAERLQYTSSEKWRGLIIRHLETIANATNIKLDNLKFYAAFHDTAHHPHIHLLVFSTAPKEKGFLQQDGIEKIKSAFVNDIFHDELQHLYQKQTKIRDNLREQSREIMEQLADDLQKSNLISPELLYLINKLRTELKNVDGKKVYGYLPKNIKATVDEILIKLSKHPVIKEMYKNWCGLEIEKYRNYSDHDVEIKPIEKQQAFKPIKNIIIKTVLGMSDNNIDFELNADEIELTDLKNHLDEKEKINEMKPPLIRTSEYRPVQNNYGYSASTLNSAFSLIKALGKLIKDDYNRKWSGQNFGVDHKLKRVIDKQKEAMGIQIDRTMEQKY